MTNREKVFAVIDRKLSGYVPFQFDLCPEQAEFFYKRYGHYDYVNEFKMPYFFLGVPARDRGIDFASFFEDLKEGSTVNEIGVGFEPSSDGSHFTHMRPCMSKVLTTEDIDAFPYPTADDYGWDGLAEGIARIKADDKVTVGALNCTVFEMGWYMWGMDRMLMDLYARDEAALYHLDKITDLRCEMARRYVRAGIDVLHLGDDVATQLDMMMNPDLWREILKPRLVKVIEAAKAENPKIYIDYHSDGNIARIVPDLIEIGVDILNPIQPECMDPVALKRQYGDRVSFRGTIGTQSVLPFGTAEDVRREVLRMIEEVGYNGGLILAPSHLIEPEVPWENILAFIETVTEYNERNA